LVRQIVDTQPVLVRGPQDACLEETERWLTQAKGNWIGEFLAWKRRGGAHGRTPKDRSLADYVKVLWRLEHDYHLDLHTVTLEGLNGFLDEYRAGHKLNGYIQTVSVIKDALNFLKRKELNEQLRIPRRASRIESIREQLLSDKEVQQLISKAPTLRDRLMIELCFELGNRRGELANLRMKDVQFDRYGAVIWLRGKTGTGSRRVYNAVPDLKEYCNNHPHRNEPDHPFLLTIDNSRPLSYVQIYNRIVWLAKHILHRHVNPHMFRHTRATQDAKYFTDREMMKLNRWNSSETIKVYAHLSMRDVDEKDLVLHGLKKREEILKPIGEMRRCPQCKAENSPIAIYCQECSEPFQQDNKEEIQELREKLDAVNEMLNLIAKGDMKAKRRPDGNLEIG